MQRQHEVSISHNKIKTNLKQNCRISTTKQGDSFCEVIICYGTRFKLSVVDLTVIEHDKR